MSVWFTMSDDDIEDVGGYVRTVETWQREAEETAK